MPIWAASILPGDLGFGPEFLGIVFLIFVLIVIAGLSLVFWSNKHPSESHRYAMAKREWVYTLVFLVVVLAFASSTLGLLPYPYAHPGVTPNVVIDVRAQQFQWCLAYYPSWGTNCQSDIKIPLGTVLFNTSSIDVTHGFGLYSSSGQLLDQVQVMPGYYNNIIYQFTTPGTYYVRCLEFCGYGHFGMVSQINVTG